MLTSTSCFAFLLTIFLSSNLATYDWPLSNMYKTNKFPELITGREATASGDLNFINSKLGVTTREQKTYINLHSTASACLGNLDLCQNGLSIAFWMNYRG